MPAAATVDADAAVRAIAARRAEILAVAEHREHAAAILDAVVTALAHGSGERTRADIQRMARGWAREPDFVLADHLIEQRRLMRAVASSLRRAGALTEAIDDVVTDVFHFAIAAAGSAARELVRDPLLAEIDSRALLDDVLWQLPVGISITDARTGRGLFQNAEANRLTERTASDRASLDDYVAYGAIHADGHSYAADEYPTTRAIRNGEIVQAEQMLYRRSDGSVRVLSVSSRPLRDDAGNIILAVTSVHDDTALREATERLRLVSDSVPIHLLLLDRDERFLFANATAAALWEHTPDELIGRTVRDVLGDEQQQALAPYTRRVLAGETVSYESPFRVPQGSVRTFLNTYAPVSTPDGVVRGFIATGTDITDRKLAEDRLRASIAELHEERALRERFVAALTHDLRTPLGAARMAADLVTASSEDPARVQRFAARVATNIERADHMIRDLLDMSLLTAGGTLPVERMPCELVPLVRQTLDELASVHGDRFVLQSPSSVIGVWDHDAMRRIVENLCGNAVKYGSTGRPITVTIADLESEVRIDVHNEGAPIPVEVQQIMFDAFQRAHTARVSGVKGWGIGLAIVKGLAEAHGGSVTLARSDEHGSVFSVRLPQKLRDGAHN